MPEPLPPSLQALAAGPRQPLQSAAVRLDPDTLADLERLRDRLNRPTRAALLRLLVREGLATIEAQLKDAGSDLERLQQLTPAD